MKSIIIDMDNVMAEVNPQYQKYMKKIHNTDIDLQQLAAQQASNTVANYDVLHTLLEQPGFFRTMKMMPQADEVIEALNKKYDVYIVSAAIFYRQSLLEKLEWLDEYFPFLKPNQICLTGSKKFVCGDYMIDDKISNLVHFNGNKLLFDHPNNFSVSDSMYQRVHSWDEIKSILL